jgi:hypothetical protein
MSAVAVRSVYDIGQLRYMEEEAEKLMMENLNKVGVSPG